MEPSDNQLEIYSEVANEDTNILVSAVAGSGKTTTLVNCLEFISNDKEILFLAFNNAIVDTLKEKIKPRSNLLITTAHSFGLYNIKRNLGNIKVDKNKSTSKIKRLIKKHKIEFKKQNYYFFILSKIIDIARLNLVETIEQLEEICDRHDLPASETELNLAFELLAMMRSDIKSFDFADMLYYPAVNEIRTKKYDYIFVDEAQDLSPAIQEIIKKSIARKGRLIAVGDPSQAIYGFAGADVESFERLKTMFKNTVQLPLSVNYRCGKNIVKLAQRLNPDIMPYDRNEDGIVRRGKMEELLLSDWVLCRNTKPLILLNLYLLSIGIKSYVRGKDIGMGLINMVTKTKASLVKQMLVVLMFELEKERKRLQRFGVFNTDNSTKIINMIERIEILQILSSGLNTTNELKQKIQEVFNEQKKAIVLSTIHKSKGLENNRIFVLCPELLPSKYAEQPWQLLQEKNLEYVMITRAKKELVYISDFKEKIKIYKDEFKIEDIS